MWHAGYAARTAKAYPVSRSYRMANILSYSGPNDVGASRYHVMRSLEGSLRRLRTDHVDLYQVHGFDFLTPIDETLGALDDAVRQGKVRYIGASNFAARQILKALGVSAREGLARFISHQCYYSLVGRDVEHEILPAAREEGLAFLSFARLSWAPAALNS